MHANKAILRRHHGCYFQKLEMAATMLEPKLIKAARSVLSSTRSDSAWFELVDNGPQSPTPSRSQAVTSESGSP